jgi:hypothetical protein
MKTIVLVTSLILNFIIIAFLIVSRIYNGNTNPNVVVFANHSGCVITDFVCTYHKNQIKCNTLSLNETISFSFPSSGDGHLEIKFMGDGKMVSTNYGYYTNGLSSIDTVLINQSNELVSLSFK